MQLTCNTAMKHYKNKNREFVKGNKYSPETNNVLSESGEDISDELLLYANGSAGKYLKLKNSDYLNSVLILQSILDEKDLLKINNTMNKFKEDKSIKDYIFDILDLLIIKLGADLTTDSLNTIERIKIIEDTYNNLKGNANFDTQLDYMALKFWKLNTGRKE